MRDQATADFTLEDLRAAINRKPRKLYLLATEIGWHPVNLSKMVNGHTKFRTDIAQKILIALALEKEAHG